jgi:uncharacterized protein YndB with AHSA1/START domain
MPPIVSSIDIARPPDEVFAYATDPSRFAEWQRDVVRVRIEGHGIGRPLLPAVRRQTQKAAPVSYQNLKVRLEGGGGR